ncbi:cupin domain-containing protein [Nocardioides sp.]|uniref:cupin domain-containing protein n=1 Tax=Nocardioides sp. TaxID=35761 RepID=UPI002BBAE1FF|nr:cupin domain-containing protein [Nocardioides sp.]HXH78624.1 cupin domain-containing protein [Nocardioides sp.]
MRILSLADLPRRPIEEHQSKSFSVGAFGICADAHLVAVTLGPRGVIGRHPASGRQLLVVLSGEAQVAGHDGTVQTIGVGQAAVWEPGEAHETRTHAGLVAMIVEGDLDIGTPGEQIDRGDT